MPQLVEYDLGFREWQVSFRPSELGNMRENRRVLHRDVGLLHLLFALFIDCLKSRRRLEVENLYLRHQLNIVMRKAPRHLRLRGADRALMVWMARLWPCSVCRAWSSPTRSCVGIEPGFEPIGVGIRHRRPPSQTWRTFLRNHANAIAAIDLCVIHTATFERLFALLIIGHGRRQLLWFAVTRHPTAEWLARQIVEAFPWDTAPT
jgi:hypothetical protein